MGSNKRKIKRIASYLFLISILVLAGIIYIYPKFTDAFVRTSLVEYGSLKVAKEESCYIVRQEKLIYALEEGRLQYYAEEGELLRKGAKVAEMMSPQTAYTADRNGLVSYYSDGLEDYFTPEKLYSLDKKEVESLNLVLSELKREVVEKGDPIFKLVDNGTWYGVIWAAKESSIRYEKGKTVHLVLPLDTVKGSINDIVDTGDGWLVILEFSRYYEDMPKLRKIQAQVITSDLEGLIIENKNITSRDGLPGVMVKDIGGKYNFRPVSVIATDGVFSLVESGYFSLVKDGESTRVKTVEPYDEIMNKPEREENE